MLGFITTRLKSIPILAIASKMNFVSITAYLIGYAAWYVASLLYPNHPKSQRNWYDFSSYKYQYQAAALLGAIATILCITAPASTLIAAWIYAWSNLIWAVGEYHKNKFQTLQNDEDFSREKQALYFRFTVLVASGSTIAAILSTMTNVMPETIFFINPIASIVGGVFMAASLYYWGKTAFYTPKNAANAVESIERRDNKIVNRQGFINIESVELNYINDINYPPLFTKTTHIVGVVAPNDTSVINRRCVLL